MRARFRAWVFRLAVRYAPLVRAWAWWTLANVAPPEDEVDAALRRAFLRAGLNQALYQPDFDLRGSGKLHEVLLHASDDLGNPLRTVEDVKALLR